MIKICQYCEKEYKTYKSKSKFCSSQCSSNKQTKKVSKVCNHCKNEYEVHKYREETSLFCSIECRESAQYKLGFDGENKICTECKDKKPLSEFWKGRTKCKTCEKERNRLYYEGNKEYISEWGKKYRVLNLEKLRIQKRIYTENNRESVRDRRKKWCDKNREKIRILKVKSEQVRRAKLKNTAATLTHEEWLDNLKYFNNECAYCGEKENLQQEHFIPVKNGGGYEKKNIIPACPFCNRSKGDRDFYAWYDWQSFFSMERAKKIELFIERNTEGRPSRNGS